MFTSEKKNFRLLYTQRTLPSLIKYCLDIDCLSNDGGIAPKNICQSCLDKLQIVFDFKQKSQESDRYLKQIISHAQPEPQPAPGPEIPYASYPDDEESLLQPMDDDFEDQQNGSASTSKSIMDQNLPKKGQRHGDFECQICLKSFKYVKALNKHMKLHKQQKLQASYYQRKKMMQAGKAKATLASSSRMKRELQPDYDTISPYNSSAPYDNDSSSHQQRDLSPDFGALMLSTSQMIGDEEQEEQEVQKEIPKTSRTGRILKRPNTDDEEYKPNGGQKRIRNRPSIPIKKTPVSTPPAVPQKKAAPPPKKVEEPPKRAGPASKTRGQYTPAPKKSEDAEEGFTIEGFSEVDITKMLKKSKKRDRMIKMGKVL